METKQKTIPIPKEENFALSKVKLLKDGGLDVYYEVTEIISNESYTNKYHVESAKDIHPDLRKLFERLRPIIGRTFKITSFLSMLETPDFKATKKQIEQARNFADEALKLIEVRGVSLSGQDDNLGCVLTALYTVYNGQKVAINTSRIKFAANSFGFEEELEEIVTEIEREVYQFLFEGKKAQLELFDGNVDELPAVNTEVVNDDAPGDDEPGDDDM